MMGDFLSFEYNMFFQNSFAHRIYRIGSYANGGAMRIAPVGLAYRYAETNHHSKGEEQGV